MTKVKKFLGMVMAALMCFALTPAAAFAANGTNDDTGSITIDNAIDKATYKAYQILVLEEYSEANGAYLYTVAPGWEDFFKTGDGAKYIEMFGTNNMYVKWNKEVNEAEASNLAKAAIIYANDRSELITPKIETANGNSVTFSDLNLGYYVVDSSVGALCSLNTTDPKAEINEKNDEPMVEKAVLENSAGSYGPSNDASIGDTVEFRVKVTGQAGAENYVLKDTMDEGLTFNAGSIKVEDANGNEVAAEYWTVRSEQDHAFEVTFDNELFAGLVRGESLELYVFYTATLNDKAQVGVGVDNRVILDYGTNNSTLEKTTTTKTWGMSIEKVDGDKPNQKLEGAEFAISTRDNEAPVYVTKTFDGSMLNPAQPDVYQVCTANDEGAQSTITTNASGKFNIEGIDSGWYVLKETQAPVGYNQMNTTIDFEVVADGDNGYGYNGTVANFTGLQLPSTGGIGTMILYVIGGLLVLGAVVVLVRRRSSAK